MIKLSFLKLLRKHLNTFLHEKDRISKNCFPIKTKNKAGLDVDTIEDFKKLYNYKIK